MFNWKWNNKYHQCSGSNETTGEILTDQGHTTENLVCSKRLIRKPSKNGFARYQTGVGIGGALVKDKTFYYFNFEHTDICTLIKCTALSVTETKRNKHL
jgi:hypothetical protein